VNARLLFCIALGVFTAHIGVVMLLSHLRPHPNFPSLPKENFSTRAAQYTDSESGEKMVYREFTVTTNFAKTTPATPPPEKPQLEAPAEGR